MSFKAGQNEKDCGKAEDYERDPRIERNKPAHEELVAVDVDKEIADFPLVPYGEKVYVKEDEILKYGSLFVPESSRKEGEMQTNMGTVLAIGDGVTFVKPGDRVFYGRYSGAWVLDQKYRVMNEEDILGRFK